MNSAMKKKYVLGAKDRELHKLGCARGLRSSSSILSYFYEAGIPAKCRRLAKSVLKLRFYEITITGLGREHSVFIE